MGRGAVWLVVCCDILVPVPLRLAGILPAAPVATMTHGGRLMGQMDKQLLPFPAPQSSNQLKKLIAVFDDEVSDIGNMVGLLFQSCTNPDGCVV